MIKMSSARIKARRYSLPSLSGSGIGSSSGKESSDRKRKVPLDGSEVGSDAKRPAMAITDFVGNLQEAVSKDQLQLSEDSLCCLPGGVCGMRVAS